MDGISSKWRKEQFLQSCHAESNTLEDALNEKRIESIYDILKPMTNVSKEEKHIERIKEQHYEEKESKKALNEKSSGQSHQPLCPYCDAEMVIRTAKQDQEPGNSSMDATAFPNADTFKTLIDTPSHFHMAVPYSDNTQIYTRTSREFCWSFLCEEISHLLAFLR